MRWHRSKVRTAFAVALLVCLAAALPSEDRPLIRVTWAMLQRGDDGTAQPVDCSGEVIRLRSGDRVRFWVKPLTDCRYYLYLHDAQDRLTLLAPGTLGAEGLAASPMEGSFLPGADAWFRLDSQPGMEILYLVLSDRRLPALESATLAGTDHPGPAGSYRPIDRPSAALQEIRRLVVRSSILVRPAEKPVPVAGDFRGLEVESGFEGLLIEARGLYVRTFRIQH